MGKRQVILLKRFRRTQVILSRKGLTYLEGQRLDIGFHPQYAPRFQQTRELCTKSSVHESTLGMPFLPPWIGERDIDVIEHGLAEDNPRDGLGIGPNNPQISWLLSILCHELSETPTITPPNFDTDKVLFRTLCCKAGQKPPPVKANL